MYTPKHFALHELLPPNLYNDLVSQGREGVGWRLMDERILKTLDLLKIKFPKGSITVNNYYWGGDRKWSGLRTPNSPNYSITSQHSYGRAVDCVFSAYSESEVRQYIIDNPDEFPDITGIEDFTGMTWVHIDCRNSDRSIFKG